MFLEILKCEKFEYNREAKFNKPNIFSHFFEKLIERKGDILLVLDLSLVEILRSRNLEPL